MFKITDKLSDLRMVLSGIFLLIGICNEVQPAIAKQCMSPPSKINLVFDFDWPEKSKSELATKLAMQCGEPENYTRLIQTLKLYLAESGVDVINITLQKNKTSSIPMIQIESVADNVKKQSAIYPVSTLPGVTDIIPVFTPNITTVEGEDIVISYVTDDMFVQSVGGVVKLQWFRDDAIIANERGAKYTLRQADVGKKISAVLSVIVDERTIAFQLMRPTSKVEFFERPPQIKKLRILGEALVGKEVHAKYQFFDMNPNDKEGPTQFTWFRGKSPILDANGSNYIIVPADVGQVISVKVKPISDDGVRGNTAVASMQNTVDDGATKFSMTIGNELDLETDENVGGEETLEAIFRDGFDDSPLLSLPIDISHSYDSAGKSPLASVQYITSDLRLAPSSPTQFIGFRHNPSTLLSSEVLDQITSELFGRPIDIALTEEVVQQINQAYKAAGFKLSYAMLPKQTVNNGLIEVKLFEDADLNHHF